MTSQMSQGQPQRTSFEETVLADCLVTFPEVGFTVTGHCMRPTVVHGARVLVSGSALRPPRLGDVVLARHREGLRLHRLVWGPPLVSGHFRWRTKADRGRSWDPALPASDVIGTVVAIDGRPCHGRPARALVSLVGAVLARLRHELAGRWITA